MNCRLWVALCVVVASLPSGPIGAAEPDPESWNSISTRPNWWSPTRTYRNKYHAWTPPHNLAAWESAREKLKTRLLVSQGLWPLPETTPLEPVIHGKIDCGDYTIEKVFFAALPGVYVTGNLYRPVGKSGPHPGVLSPHGHWQGGRFYDAGDDAAAKQIAQGAEQFSAAAHSPMQARMVHLARMGCVVFHYDMIGYADNQFLDHAKAFTTPADGLWLLESMGLQTWNSLRALDFLCELDDVDPERIAVTGASGGGTQTFVLGAIDSRVKVAMPAVMVSTDMQGGCYCENSPYLRIDANNVAYAALFAPRPLGLTGANDWTVRIASRGLPELKEIYSYYDSPESVQAWVYPQFGHNYNGVSRAHMYAWFAEHLNLPDADLKERDFELKSPAELTVFDAEHPQPADAATNLQVREAWIEQCQQQLTSWVADDDTGRFESIVRPAAEVLLGGPAPEATEIVVAPVELSGESNMESLVLTRAKVGRVIPVQIRSPQQPNGKIVFLFSEQGIGLSSKIAAGKLPKTASMIADGSTVIFADVTGTGANRPTGQSELPAVNADYYGYTFGYNSPLISQRVQDILTVFVGLKNRFPQSELELIGLDSLGLPVLLAQGLLEKETLSVFSDLSDGGFADVTSFSDPNYLPGALKYGGAGGLARLSDPSRKIAILAGEKPLKSELQLLFDHNPGALSTYELLNDEPE